MINGLKTLHFDGVNDQMATASFAAKAQPFAVVMICRIYNQNNGVVFGSNSAQISELTGLWNQFNGNFLFGGRLDAVNGFPGIGVHIIAALFGSGNGAAAMLIDGQEVIALGNAGANTLTQVSIGATPAGSVACNCDIGRVQVYTGAAYADLATISQQFATQYGLTLNTDPSVTRAVFTGTEPVSGQNYTIITPKGYVQGTPAPLMIYYPGGSQDNTIIMIDAGTNVVVDAYLASGFICAALGTGTAVGATPPSFWSLDASNQQLAAYLAFWNYLTANYTINTSKVIHWGVSRGGLCAIIAASGFNPGVPRRGLMLIDGVTSLSNWYGTISVPGTGFAEINIAYNIAAGGANPTYAQQSVSPSQHDPLLVNPIDFKFENMYLSYSLADLSVSQTANMVPFISRVAAFVNETVVVTLLGHTDPTHYRYAPALAWIQGVLVLSSFANVSFGVYMPVSVMLHGINTIWAGAPFSVVSGNAFIVSQEIINAALAIVKMLVIAETNVVISDGQVQYPVLSTLPAASDAGQIVTGGNVQ
jgi:hypothetical protein